MTNTNNTVNITKALEIQIIDELKARLNLKTDKEVKYWITQTLSNGNVKDWLVNEITHMIDSNTIKLPLNNANTFPHNIPQVNNTIRFNTVQGLYHDMVTSYQSFTIGQSEMNTHRNKMIIEGGTPYRLVELKHGKLEFHSNKSGGADLRISGNVQYAERVDVPDCGFSEYRIYIDGRNEPLILLACKAY